MSGEPEPLMKWLVNKHNELRYRHGVQMLTWDWSLAWNAYNYVVGCPKGHSGQQGIGENLAWGHQDFNHAMRDWYNEVGGWMLHCGRFQQAAASCGSGAHGMLRCGQLQCHHNNCRCMPQGFLNVHTLKTTCKAVL